MFLAASCPICDEPGPAPCEACRRSFPAPSPAPVPPQLQSCHALVAYSASGRKLVTTLKYANRRSALPWIAAALVASVDVAVPAVVTWAPTTPARARGRGYDQARLIARSVATVLGVPARRLLARRSSGHQTGRSRRDRLDRPVFAALRSVAGCVVVVDDVVTTGATMTAAGTALRAAGADQVVGLAIARTPSRAQVGGVAGRSRC